MRQEDILAIMRAHHGPMTVTEILAETSEVPTASLRSSVWTRMTTLARQGVVRRTGNDGGRTLWEVVE